MTQEGLIKALRDCYDPALQRNIVELGAVREVSVEPDADAPGAGIPGVPTRYKASVTLQPGSADEAAVAQLRAQVENRLAGMPEFSSVHVTMLPAAFRILR